MGPATTFVAIAAVAAKLHMSPRTLQRRLRDTGHRSFAAYLQWLERLGDHHWAELLQEHNVRIRSAIDDLRALLTFVADNREEISSHYGLVSTQSVAAVQRKSAMTSSLSEMMKAISAPTRMPGAMIGSVRAMTEEDRRKDAESQKLNEFADAKRQVIPWVETIAANGKVRVYCSTDNALTDKERTKLETRTMDCIDCHNRPSHVFPTANEAVERSLASGALSLKLPNIKRVAVQAMTQESIKLDADAPQQIADFIRTKYSDKAVAAEVPKVFGSAARVTRADALSKLAPTGGELTRALIIALLLFYLIEAVAGWIASVRKERRRNFDFGSGGTQT